jgi:predicted DNA-binding protein with PD1-like motif
MVDSTTTETRRVIVAKMKPGEDILETIQKVCKDYNVVSGELSLIGAVGSAKLGYFNREKGEYTSFTVEEDVEVVSCSGNISKGADDEYVVHAHMIVSDEEGRCYAGHLMQGCIVSVTIELIVTEFNDQLRRARDPHTGLNLLDLK